jgi:hypothetical protein
MWHHAKHSLPVPALIAMGIASWILIGAGYASLHHGHWGPAMIGTVLFIAAVALLCRAAVRHQAPRRSARATR